jgi:hypothetical protein
VSQRLSAPDTARFPTLAAAHVKTIPAGTLLGRIHWQGGLHPTTWDEFRRFGPTGSRFDHQPPPRSVHSSRGILYAAIRAPKASILETCVLECFQQRRVVELRRDDPYLVLFETTRELRLLNLASSNWITRAGGNAAISSGLRSMSRGWSRAVYRTYKDVDGLYFPCSLNPPARSIALYERAVSALPARPLVHMPLTHASLRAELEAYASDYVLGLLP